MAPTAIGSDSLAFVEMAKHVVTQADFRVAQRQTFCYLCAKPFEAHETPNRDHVPPSALFSDNGREPALILPTHVSCNERHSADDEVISQLVGVLRGRPIAPHGRKPEFVGGTFSDGSFGIGTLGLDLRRIIFRWVCGFHAALYNQPMGPSSYMVFPPLPEGRVVGGRVDAVPVPAVIPKLVAELKRNRLTRTFDVVTCRNGRCHYECLWSQADDGRRICIWALDLHGWKKLGDLTHFEGRACVGTYRPSDGIIPEAATLGTQLEFSIPTDERLNPFGN